MYVSRGGGVVEFIHGVRADGVRLGNLLAE